jgi:macrolide transport system ATP-binding/permease protein
MSFIQLENINFSYNESRLPLFSNLSLNFHNGWSSICGPNGSGKTTLIKLITGELRQETGILRIKGDFISVPQSTENPPSQLEDFLWNYSKEAIYLREKLEIKEDWNDRWETLSIGERKRLQIAVALSSSREILLVDEPTNHVDFESKKIILSALKSFSGIGILVSHDRLLLNELCGKTIFLEGGQAFPYSASYSEAKKEHTANKEQKFKLKDKLQEEQKRLGKAVQAQQEKIDQGSKNLSKKGISAKDHDAKEKVNQAKLFGAGLSDSRKKNILQKREEKVKEQKESIHLEKTYELGIFFGNSPRVKNVFLEEEIYSLPYLKIIQPRIALKKGDKLAITGRNGAGKSTLLKLWLEKLPQPYSYAPQEFSEKEMEELTKEILLLDKEKRGKIFTLVSCLGSSPKSLADKSPPSPGVWQKLMIARAIVEEVPLLILDEPTNHMDLPSLEILEEALIRYEGIIICISHDKEFMEKVCTLSLHLEKKEEITVATLMN